MGVRINVSKTYKTDVNFTILTPEGKDEKQSFKAEFKRLTREEVKELIDAKKTDSEMVREVLVGWTMKNIDSGESIDFAAENVEDFLKIPGAAAVVILRYFDTVGANREKN